MPQTNHELKTRKAYVAGQFYPGNPVELKKELEKLFSGCTSEIIPGPVLAIISPHAGYVYSAGIATESFKQINRDQKFDNIFLIGSSHHVSFDGASVYTQGNFETPLGIVPVNISLAEKLVKDFSFFNSRTDAQFHEHSLEVQLPFLQYWLKKPFCIVPIVLGTQSVSTCRKIAGALKDHFNGANLFIISTDFSHYPNYQDAQVTDRKTANAILTNNPDRLLRTLESNYEADIPGLATSLCGWTSVLTLMFMTGNMPGVTYRLIDYKNSGDAGTAGDRSRVVGYCSIAVYPPRSLRQPQNQEPGHYHITDTDRADLLKIARESIRKYIISGIKPETDETTLSPILLEPAGAFVSLYRKGNLRGCVGRFNPEIPLYEVVKDMAISSATQDCRFENVEIDELSEIKIEISVLTRLKRIGSIQEIVLGKNGILIKKGPNSGTYLPQVATKTGWKLEEFLGHCSRDKAGIGWDGWKNAEIYTYEAIIISEK